MPKGRKLPWGAFFDGFGVPNWIAEGAIIGYHAVFGTQTSTVRSDPMPKKSIEDWKTDDRGNYPRKVGKWRNNAGKIKPKPFKFGKNKAQAKARLARVEELWSFVVEAASAREQEQSQPTNPYSYDPPIARQPIWNGEPLWIAFELAKGKVQIEVPRQ